MYKAVPIIIDEMNIVHQYKKLNLHHISWTSFYSALRHMINVPAIAPYFACAKASENGELQDGRSRFFEALRMRGVTVLEGFTVQDSNRRRLEKGVDVLVALQIYKEALTGAKDIIVCSADSNLVPAILEAQALGVRVHVVVSEFFPAYGITQVADRVISLESVLAKVIDKGNVKFKDQTKPFMFSTSRSYMKERIGLVSA
ncbi:MAG: NYN domain-containing protein [Kurthia sp.]|nr:NYN domain-containing protein [Candidatus Kurthia equi]